jgi:hypothetical protein
VLDSQDADLAADVAAEGIEPAVMPTIMQTDEDKIALARQVLQFAARAETTVP